jgi:hypothetical protein
VAQNIADLYDAAVCLVAGGTALAREAAKADDLDVDALSTMDLANMIETAYDELAERLSRDQGLDD